MFISILLVVQTLLLSPLETFAKREPSTSSESSHVIDETDSSVIKKGIPELEKKITLQREQPKAEKKEESDSSKSEETNESSESTEKKPEETKDSKNSQKSEKDSGDSEKEKKKSSREFATMADQPIATFNHTDGLTYRVWPDGNAGVVGFGGSGFANITIPATVPYNGKNYKVIDIYQSAFKDKTQVKTLSFVNGNNLQRVYPFAFQFCTKLESVNFSNCNNLITISEETFAGSSKLAVLKFPTQSKLRTIGFNAFRNCYGLKNSILKIPDSVKSIDHDAFVIGDNYYKEVHHKKVASVKGSLPSLEVAPVELPKEAEGYESWVDSSKDKTLLHKAAKWTSDDRTTAEIRIDYGYDFDRLAKLDVIFVMDCSASMTWPANAKDEQGVAYNFPRGFLSNDIVYDASKMLVDNKLSGYDNQVAMVGFEGKSKSIFKSNGYTNSSEDVKNFLIENPNITAGDTHYGAGLQGAIDILDQYPSTGRIPAVIFLSDGLPHPFTETNRGISQANKLRSRGINVYPIGIYLEKDSQLEQAKQSLKDISFDKKTAYFADDTDAFEKIMAKVLHDVVNHAEPLNVQIEDILSDKFEVMTGNDDLDYELSPDGGRVTRQGQKITWNLDGCAQGVAHTLKIKVKVKEGTELSATGVLPTNDSMGATNGSIESTEQPQLDRYLAHHRFENEADPNANLPEEVLALLPGTKGGYGKGQRIEATKVDPTEVKTKDGRTWKFIGWDEDHKTIVDGDVTFVGKWRFIGYDFSFIKLDNDGQGLEGAEFSLYLWKGSGSPTNSDLATKESIAAGKWNLIDKQVSQQNGRVDFYVPAEEGKYFQLAETQAPTSYAQPQGQWRFTFDVNGHIENNQLVGIGGQNNTLPPSFEVIEEGDFKGFLGVKNIPAGGQLPATGGLGRSGFTIKAAAFCSIGLVLSGLYLFINRRKN